MKRIISINLLAAAALALSGPLWASVPPQAMELYGHKVYQGARTLFLQDSDPLSQDYAVLCAVKLSLPESEELVKASDERVPRTILNSTIHHEYGLSLFDAGKFVQAMKHFEMVEFKKLEPLEQAELKYKMGHCLFDIDNCEQALKCFAFVAEQPSSEYFSASRYFLGCVEYRLSHFAKAEEWFRLASGDPRFKELCEFYLVDCRFMLGDYDYVIREGENIYPNLPPARAKHISRLISEAWLVKGNAGKAKDYLVLEDLTNPTDESLFHAASVLYASMDYKEAASCFAAMKQKTDSVGQVAQYQLGDSYIHLGNKVAAIDAFKAAADLDFDQNLKEDAFFNYAKLSFDVNSDVKPFKDYIARYNTSKKGEVIYSYMAITALASRDYSAAVEAYDNIETLDPDQKRNYIKANFLRADQLRRQGSFKEAAKYLKYASVYLPKQDRLGQMCRYYIAEYLFRSSDFEGALGGYMSLYNESALNGTPEGAHLSYDIAYCYFRLERYADASRYFDIYLAYRSKDARRDALIRRADCDFALRSYSQAAAYYQKALDEYKSDTQIYPSYQLGLSYGFVGQKEKKASALSRVMTAGSDDEYYMPALGEYARTLLEIGRSAEAKTAFELLKKNARDPEFATMAIMGLATISRNAGKYDEAIAGFQKVVGLMPGSAQADDALLSLKAVYMELGTPEKYESWLSSHGLAAKLSPKEKEEMYFSSAETKFLSGRWQDASKALKRFLKDYPGNSHLAETYYYLGECARMTNDRQKACDWYSKSLETTRENSVSELAALGKANMKYALELYEEAYSAFLDLNSMARIQDNRNAACVGMMRSAFRTKRHDECIAAAGAVLKFQSDAALEREARYDMAKSYLSTSRRSEAFEILKELRKEPSTPEGAEAEYLIIKSQYDWGNYESVQTDVYNFSERCGEQSYWLAKAFIVLGDSFVAVGNVEQARVTYQSIIDGYSPSGPDDDVVAEATKKLAAL